MSVYEYAFPTQIFFGAGSRRKIESLLKSKNLAQPLVVTDQALGKLPVFQTFIEDLKLCHLRPTVFSEIWGNPVDSQVENGVISYQKSQSDCIIVMGGGAAMDCAKVIALLASHAGRIEDFQFGKKPLTEELPYLVAIPTTAGTGSEVGRASLISDDQTHAKRVFFDPKLLPKSVILDPELSLSLPPEPTAATGMDALTHLIEANISKGYHPLAEAIALGGIQRVFNYLPLCVTFAKKKEGATTEHLNARAEMLMAASMGAVAFQKGLGITHSCANALTTLYPHLHHGLVNGILLPYVLQWNESAAESALTSIASVIGEKDSQGLIRRVEKLKSKIGIPKKLSEVGVELDQVESLADHAVSDGCTAENPRQTSKDDFIQLFKKAID